MWVLISAATNVRQASFRLAEAMEAQAVPIYVYESTLILPFSVRWSRISISLAHMLLHAR